MKYYSLNVDRSDNDHKVDGFSVPIKIEDADLDYINTDIRIIEYAIAKGLIDREDHKDITYIPEISENEYFDLLNA